MEDDRTAGPTPAFWQQRFESRLTPWDRGSVHPALESFARRFRASRAADSGLPADSGLAGRGAPVGREGRVHEPPSVLIPGCGAGHEVLGFAQHGLRVVAIDYAPAALQATRERLAQAGLTAQLVQADLFDWRPDALFDLVWDQACLCALHPDRWVGYASRLAQWLRPGGTLALLAVQVERDGLRTGLVQGPPYHCDINAVRALFPAPRWSWHAPPYATHAHPAGVFGELQIELVLEGTGPGEAP
jgi:SAM-dependent methyltransferase